MSVIFWKIIVSTFMGAALEVTYDRWPPWLKRSVLMAGKVGIFLTVVAIVAMFATGNFQ